MLPHGPRALLAASSTDTNGDLSSRFGGSGPDDFSGQGERNGGGSWGTKLEGKVAARGCVKF